MVCHALPRDDEVMNEVYADRGTEALNVLPSVKVISSVEVSWS